MVNSFKKRGQKLIRRFSRASIRASEEGRDHIKENLVGRISGARDVRLLIFEWGLLVTGLIMLALTQAFWFGDSYADNAFVAGGNYTEATIGEVKSMNPLFATTSSEEVLSKLMFARITTIDYSGHPGNELAEYVRASADGRVWTMKLREGLKWSDGEPITNNDVLFTVKLIQNPAVNTVYTSNLANVKVAENENGEVVFTLPVAYADFNSALNIPIVPEHILGSTDPRNLLENAFSNAPVTSGPFTFNALQSSGNGEKVFYLSANANYYAGKPMLSSFAVHVYNDEGAVIRAVNSGAVTATAELSGSEIEKVTSNNFLRKESRLNSGAFIFFNTSTAVVGKKEVRTAIRQGINLARIRGMAPGTAALDYPLLESQIKLNSYPTIPEQDFEAARAKIVSLYGDERPRLEIATVNSGYLPAVTEVLKEELEALGFEVNMTAYDESQEFVNNIISKRAYDILVYEAELGAEPDLLPYYHSSQASSTGLNLSNYKNFLVNDLLLAARETMNVSLRAAKYEKFLQYWIADVPAIGLYQPNLTYFYNKNVRSFSNDVRIVTAIDRFADVTNWAVNKGTKNKTP